MHSEKIPVGHLFLQIQEGWDLQKYLIAWALQELENGSEASSILELAGYTSPINNFEFNATLKELCAEFSISFANPTECIIRYINEISAQINNRDPETLISDIRNALYLRDCKY